MSAETKIEWTDASWSPWRGCTKVSAGCAHCYAETLSKRNPKVLGEWGKGKPRVKAKSWGIPKRWNKQIFARCDGCEFRGVVPSVFNSQPCPNCSRLESLHHDSMRVFPSLLDWLDDEVPIEWLAEFLQLIHDTPYLTWQLLTKRPENWKARLQAVSILESVQADDAFWQWIRAWVFNGKAPANVQIGISAEDQANWDKRVPELLKIPALVRFVSAEPLLGPIDMELVENGAETEECESWVKPTRIGCEIHWVIIGGESGKDSRPCNVDWIRSIAAQCQAAQVPVFVKQLGSLPFCERNNLDGSKMDDHYIALKHPKGGDMNEWPTDLRIRQFPTINHSPSTIH